MSKENWGHRWTAEDTAVVAKNLDRPWRDLIPLLPHRGAHSLRSKWVHLRQYARTPDAMARELVTDTHDVDSNVAQNNNFCAAMVKAIRAGLETAPIVTVKTPFDTDFRPQVFHAEPRGLGACALADI